MNFKLISNIHIFLYIIFCIQIYKILSEISLRYPYSLYLSNGNIFVIHEKGITIYDHLMTNQIEDVITFSENDEIKTSDLSKLTTVFEDEYLFCIIKDKIYIFNDKGNILFHNNTSIIWDEMVPKYYSLVVMKIEDNFYQYIILFIFNAILYQTQFQFNVTSKENLFIYNKRIYDFDHYLSYEYNYALSCQYMIDKDKNNLLVCFSLSYSGLNYVKLIVEKSIIKIAPKFKPEVNEDVKDIKCIKSVANSSCSKALVSLYSSTGELKSFAFNINEEYFYKININQYLNNNTCKDSYFALNMYYNKYNGKFINSCLDPNGNILIELYDKNLNIYHYQIINNNKTIIYGYSILYSNCTEKFFLFHTKNLLNYYLTIIQN